MALLEELLVKLSLDDAGFASGIEKSMGSLSKGFMDLGNTVNMAVGGALLGAGAAVGGFLATSISAAADAEKVQAQLAAVIQSTGGAAGMTASAVNDLANGLSKMTPFEDDAIVAGENMLLTFTNIGKDVFPATTETMLDMSQALGQDMKSSAMQLGKALNDPVNGVTALTRVGVTFTDEQKNMIKQMVATGDVAGAQKVILAELNKEFGGSAQAAGKTFAGSLEILKNTFGNLQEEVGGKLLPILTPLIQQFAKMAQDIIPVVAEKMQFVIDKVLALYGAFQEGGIGGFIESLKTNFGEAGTVIGTVVQFITDHIEEVKGAIAGIGVALAAAGIVAAVVGIAAAIANPITLIVGLAALLGAAWAGNWGGIRDTLMNAWNAMQPVIEAVRTVITAVINALTPIFQNLFTQVQGGFVNLEPLMKAFGALWVALQPVIENIARVAVVAIGIAYSALGGIINAIQPFVTMIVGIVTGMVTILTGIINVLVGVFTGNFTLIRTGVEQIIGGMRTVVESYISGMINTVVAFVSGFVETFLGYFSAMGVDVVKIVPKMVDKIVKSFSNLGSSVIQQLINLPNDFTDIGISLMQGLINGINSMVLMVITTISGVSELIVSAIKQLLGISSPSKVMRGVGVNIGQGLVGGIMASIPAIQDAMSNVGTTINQGFGDVQARSMNQSSNYAFYAPVYMNSMEDITTAIQGRSY